MRVNKKTEKKKDNRNHFSSYERGKKNEFSTIGKLDNVAPETLLRKTFSRENLSTNIGLYIFFKWRTITVARIKVYYFFF